MGLLPDEDELGRIRADALAAQAVQIDRQRWQEEANAAFAPRVRALELETYAKAMSLGSRPFRLERLGTWKSKVFGGGARRFIPDRRACVCISPVPGDDKLFILEDGTLVREVGDYPPVYRTYAPDQRMPVPLADESRESYLARCEDSYLDMVQERRSCLERIARDVGSR